MARLLDALTLPCCLILNRAQMISVVSPLDAFITKVETFKFRSILWGVMAILHLLLANRKAKSLSLTSQLTATMITLLANYIQDCSTALVTSIPSAQLHRSARTFARCKDFASEAPARAILATQETTVPHPQTQHYNTNSLAKPLSRGRIAVTPSQTAHSANSKTPRSHVSRAKMAILSCPSSLLMARRLATNFVQSQLTALGLSTSTTRHNHARTAPMPSATAPHAIYCQTQSMSRATSAMKAMP
jgi:hypothetical protein